VRGSVYDDLKTEIVCVGDDVLVEVTGEIDLATKDQFDIALRQAIALSRKFVSVDLGGVAYLGSEAVGSLLRARQRARKESVVLQLVAVTPRVRRLLEITGTAELLLPALGRGGQRT
jgi:anti-anti-sigma factor